MSPLPVKKSVTDKKTAIPRQRYSVGADLTTNHRPNLKALLLPTARMLHGVRIWHGGAAATEAPLPRIPASVYTAAPCIVNPLAISAYGQTHGATRLPKNELVVVLREVAFCCKTTPFRIHQRTCLRICRSAQQE